MIKVVKYYPASFIDDDVLLHPHSVSGTSFSDLMRDNWFSDIINKGNLSIYDNNLDKNQQSMLDIVGTTFDTIFTTTQRGTHYGAFTFTCTTLQEFKQFIEAAEIKRITPEEWEK